jgi:hypothetical protein
MQGYISKALLFSGLSLWMWICWATATTLINIASGNPWCPVSLFEYPATCVSVCVCVCVCVCVYEYTQTHIYTMN